MTFPHGLRRAAVISSDLAVILIGYIGAFLLRFDFAFDRELLEMMLRSAPAVLASYYVSISLFGLYRGLIHYSSFSDLLNIAKAAGCGGVLGAASVLFLRQGQFPRSILVLQPILVFLGICAVRFSIRMGKDFLRAYSSSGGERRKALIVGAGELGESILRQILKTPQQPYEVVGLIDDDPAKWGRRLHGYTVLGDRGRIAEILRAKPVDEIIIAISARRGEILRSVVDSLRAVKVKPDLKIAPSLDEMLASHQGGLQVRKVKPSDLLNRDVVGLDEKRIGLALRGKTVLITGAGGTIGGELARQVLRYNPSRVLLLESHATSLFHIESELRERVPVATIVPVLADIRDAALVERIFKSYRPNIVLHAAAHKHVHQLEFNVHEGVANNVLGTYQVATAARKHSAEAFLLVSTDKAVRPSSVMGATKRAAEMIVRAFGGSSATRFAAVRFGNVLGSSGSVLPIFQDQIAKGGPVTVTDERVTRYFMTVEEAVGLILQAVSMAKGGEVFVLRMGTPVKIIDMARNLILLSGLEPGKDIEIRITGLRQGEKVDEELVEDPTGVRKSEHPDIMLLQAENNGDCDIEDRVRRMEKLIRKGESGALVEQLRECIPTFQPSPSHLAEASEPRAVLEPGDARWHGPTGSA